MSDLNFDPKKHDARVAKRVDLAKMIDQQEAAKQAKIIIAREYQNWKRRLIKGKVKIETKADLVQQLYKLHDTVATVCKHTPGMGPWRTFTMNMLEDKISAVIDTEAGKKNQIFEYLPASVRENQQSLTIAEKAVFETLEELQAVKFVKKITAQEGFVGLVRNAKFINALFTDGELVPVGICLTLVGIQTMPTVEQFQKAIAEDQKKKGNGEE